MDIAIRPSAIHGLGGFATQPIPAGTRIVEYVGQKIDKAESLRRCAAGQSFIFYFDAGFDLDGNVPENQARWLNHSCDPNSEAQSLGGQIWIVARRAIEPGEEITFDYGYDLESYREHPCHCGSKRCTGYIVDEVFRSKQSSDLQSFSNKVLPRGVQTG